MHLKASVDVKILTFLEKNGGMRLMWITKWTFKARFDQIWKITFHFSIIKLWNDLGYHHILKSSVYLRWLLCIKLKCSEYNFSYNTAFNYEHYRDSDKGTIDWAMWILSAMMLIVVIDSCGHSTWAIVHLSML